MLTVSLANCKPGMHLVYLDGNMSENGRMEVNVRDRIQTGANAWRNLQVVFMDRKISRKQ